MHQAFLDYFRCPSEFATFKLQGSLRSEQGFFRFGPEAICFGRTSSQSVRKEPDHLRDIFDEARVEDKSCYLPFDPDEIIANLRLERYVSQNHATEKQPIHKRLIRGAYYAIRPLLPVPIRKRLQRQALRGWDQRPFPHWPVDHSVEGVFERMLLLAIRANRNEPIPFIWFWPDGFSSCAVMTHDVETATGRDFCPALMDLTDSFGIKSSFQFVPEQRYDVPEDLLNLVRSRGFEVNIHDLNHDGNLFRERGEFYHRVEKINEYGRKFGAVGYRSGVLYRNLNWYEAFDFEYDMSVPNVGHLDPQAGGCCTTKPYFIGKVLEIPVTAIQDYSLFHILQQYSTEIWRNQIRLIMEKNGCVNFIVHPDYVIDSHARKIYSDLLSHLAQLKREADMWIPLPRELNRWWRARSQMRLVEHNGKWEVEGAGSERARVVFAEQNNGRLEFHLSAPVREAS